MSGIGACSQMVRTEAIGELLVTNLTIDCCLQFTLPTSIVYLL